jgi:hypothetical protein
MDEMEVWRSFAKSIADSEGLARRQESPPRVPRFIKNILPAAPDTSVFAGRLDLIDA